MEDKVIKDIISAHGASVVYKACSLQMEGKRGLNDLGVDVKTMADVNSIMTEAFKAISPQDRAMDVAECSIRLAMI